jgi:hypothetical protein
MRAIVFSIGETTTELCKWSLERLGLEVTVMENENTTLWHKLKHLYNHMDEDIIRVDADIVCNQNVLKLIEEAQASEETWWLQSTGWDWYHQELAPMSVSYIKKVALPFLRSSIEPFRKAERPESQMFRLDEFHNPRRCFVSPTITGLHGYGQNDLGRVKDQKRRRKQTYDWELIEKIIQL